jgi:pimeloyl-ACP methyl ester carboxylesterase
METRWIDTARGTRCRVFETGRGAPLVFLHGAGGLGTDFTPLEHLGQHFHVFAPEFPGFGESTGEELLDDMLDFALHGWDVVDALGLEGPSLIGHSMGGMTAAEMACIAPNDVDRLVLTSAAGLWLDQHPIPDLFAMLPFELPPLLFHDPEIGAAALTGGTDFSDMDALQDFFIGNARRLGTAGKILFPVPNRRVAKRLYRLKADTLVVWGESDRFIPRVYADRWIELLPKAELVVIPEAGHMVPYEQPARFTDAVVSFIG